MGIGGGVNISFYLRGSLWSCSWTTRTRASTCGMMDPKGEQEAGRLLRRFEVAPGVSPKYLRWQRRQHKDVSPGATLTGFSGVVENHYQCDSDLLHIHRWMDTENIFVSGLLDPFCFHKHSSPRLGPEWNHRPTSPAWLLSLAQLPVSSCLFLLSSSLAP